MGVPWVGTLVITFLAFAAFCYGSDLDFDGDMSLRVDHSLDMGETWEQRGTLSLSKSRSSIPTLNQGPLSTESLEKIANLCTENQYYLIKVSGDGVDEMQSYASACTLIASGLADHLTIVLDWRANPVAANLAARNVPKAGGHSSGKLDTRVQVLNMENGPTPDTAAYIQKMEEEKSRKLSGDKQDNRSFFAKYWMYIVPLCIIMLINSAGAPENGGGAPAR
eukprot:TRINITY_DN3683_c0_g1_i12.p1 TRINITY_DN3683_c0_g1~~TRINITY_DN3683_c0_g1_i12.p1  ORF type:complete len:222 (-),score=64.68 TRINITY_DN3683_c0_g1_i12:348-1013(-)